MTTSIHRLLDEAFTGVTMTPDVHDLKEELRGNLSARASELEANGADAVTAARTAIAELGDIRELIDSVGADSPQKRTDHDEFLRNRVKPRPAFVVRTVVLSLLLAAAIVLLVLQALHLVGAPVAVAAVVVFTLTVGIITADSLRQETTQHFPSPPRRALAWGAAAAVFALGLGLGALAVGGFDVRVLIGGIAATLAGVIGFVWLGVTQTNRTKPWALTVQRNYAGEDRFSKDPAAAARFGLYTIVIWTVAIVGFVVLTIVFGFTWSWLALVAGLVVFFLVLARMLFPVDAADK